jgi:short-subunit dehydrogenase
MSHLVVLGASRGLGAAIAIGLPKPGDHVCVISRTEPDYLARADGVERVWIKADLADPHDLAVVYGTIGERPIDVLVFCAGNWQAEVFDRASDAVLRSIVDTNVTALLVSLRHLIPNLRAAGPARVILIGSTYGEDNSGAASVAYVATKFAVRGVAHALREMFRDSAITVTCISPGFLASDVPYDLGAAEALDRYDGKRIPLQDIVALLQCVCSLSSASCVKEVVVPAREESGV